MSQVSGFEFFLGSQVCHITSFYLCSRGSIDLNELQLDVALDLAEEGKPVSLHIINNCLYYLRRHGLVQEAIEAPKEYEECLERAQNDKRIKNPRRYCARKYPVRVYVKPARALCEELVTHARNYGALSGWESWPVFRS